GRAPTALRELVRDLEDVAERIAHHGPAVAVRHVDGWLHGLGAGAHRPPIDLVRIVDVDVEERREAIAISRRTHHDDRVTDQDRGRPAGVDRAGPAEHRAEEVDLGHDVGYDDSRRHRVETVPRSSVRGHRTVLPSLDRYRSCPVTAGGSHRVPTGPST